MRRLEVLLNAFSQRSVENARRAREHLLGCQNARKAPAGGLAGLQDPAVMAQKQAEEDALLRAAAERPELAAALRRPPCRRSTSRCKTYGDTSRPIRDARRRPGLPSRLFSSPGRWSAWPRNCRSPTPSGSASTASPTWTRSARAVFHGPDLRRPGDAPAGRFAGHVPGAERLRLRPVATRSSTEVMAGKGPQQRAAELVHGTKLADVAVRRRLGRRRPAEPSKPRTTR